MYRILVPDAETRKAFDVISILAYSFPDIPIICGNTDGSKSRQRHLNWIFKCNIEPLRTGNEILCIEDFKTISAKYSNDYLIFIPTEENTIAHFYKFIKIYGKINYKFILPTENVFGIMRDKKQLNDYCLEHNLNAPIQYQISDIDSLKDYQYPILLKPCIGSGSVGQYRLFRKEDYTTKIHEEINGKPYLVQELIPNGHDVQGAFFLYFNGKIVNAYSHLRLRTSPPSGGVTIFSKLDKNDQLIAEGAKILNTVGWNGLIMLEFLYDNRTEQYKVIEANPRIWGSIMLSEYAGSNLLSNYVRLCLDKPIRTSARKEDTYIRWFFPVDLLNYIKSMGKIPKFWNLQNTCFINWTFARKSSAILFNLFNLFNFNNIIRFFRR